MEEMLVLLSVLSSRNWILDLIAGGSVSLLLVPDEAGMESWFLCLLERDGALQPVMLFVWFVLEIVFHALEYNKNKTVKVEIMFTECKPKF